MDALAQVQAAGLTAFILADGRLGVTPAESITPELREVIKAHKVEILARLREPLAEIAGEVEPSAPSAEPPIPAPVEAASELAPTSADCWPALCFYGHIPRWQRPDGGWVCAVCRPPVNGEMVVGLADEPQAPPPERAEEQGWDPRPDLTGDSELWARLLAMAYDLDGDSPDGLFGALHGLRCMGAGLVVIGGKAKLVHGEMPQMDYDADRTTYLLQHQTALIELLSRLDMAEEQAA
jgi:hypothetical protein